MAPLTDPVRLEHYRAALSSWDCTGYVKCTRVAEEWVRENLSGLTMRGVFELMYRHVEAGGEIDEVPERRPEWSEHRFHYDLRLPIAEHDVYIETRLLMDEQDIEESTIHVVSIHDA